MHQHDRLSRRLAAVQVRPLDATDADRLAGERSATPEQILHGIEQQSRPGPVQRRDADQQQAEQEATIRAGARALTAVYQATVPWCTVIIRKVFGVAGAGNQNHTRFHYRYAWPSADWGSLPIEGSIEAAYKAELDAAEDRATRASCSANSQTSPHRCARRSRWSLLTGRDDRSHARGASRPGGPAAENR